MSLEYPSFKIIEVKNCRKYLKRCYTLLGEIDLKLLEQLEDYGILNIKELSKFHPEAKDVFSIKLDNFIEISGVVYGNKLFITLAKSNIHLIKEIESILINWHIENTNS